MQPWCLVRWVFLVAIVWFGGFVLVWHFQPEVPEPSLPQQPAQLHMPSPLDLHHASSREVRDLLLAFEDPGLSRQELLGRCHALLHSAPHGPQHLALVKVMPALVGMALDEQARMHRPPATNPSLDTKAHIAALIAQLQEQQRSLDAAPHECEILPEGTLDFASGADSPAQQLVALGHAAVPQLIAALDDQRLTRLIDLGGPLPMEARVVRVGDCALAILERISGQTLCSEHFSQMTNHGLTAEAKCKAQTWWHEVQNAGSFR